MVVWAVKHAHEISAAAEMLEEEVDTLGTSEDPGSRKLGFAIVACLAIQDWRKTWLGNRFREANIPLK